MIRLQYCTQSLQAFWTAMIDTELRGSTTEVKSFKMSCSALNLFILTFKTDITSFVRRLLKT